MADLFTIEQLASYLQQDLDTSSATVARTVAQGLLLSATGLPDFPTPVPGDMFGWGLELAGLIYHNPLSVSSESVDDYRVAFDAGRREQILKQAARSYGTAGTPQHSFPEWDWSWTAVDVTVD